MASFSDLSREERNLYNPAFVGLLAIRATQGYERERSAACHIALVATVTAMALTPQVRLTLPKTTAATVVTWIEQEFEARTLLGQSVQAFGPLIRTGILYALRKQALKLSPPSALSSTRVVTKSIINEPGEVAQIQRSAQFLGRWLPQVGDVPTILSLLGVRP